MGRRIYLGRVREGGREGGRVGGRGGGGEYVLLHKGEGERAREEEGLLTRGRRVR